jgi:hypothetical protein
MYLLLQDVNGFERANTPDLEVLRSILSYR